MSDWANVEQSTLLELLDHRLDRDRAGRTVPGLPRHPLHRRADGPGGQQGPNALASLGVRHGSTVATMLENGPAAVGVLVRHPQARRDLRPGRTPRSRARCCATSCPTRRPPSSSSRTTWPTARWNCSTPSRRWSTSSSWARAARRSTRSAAGPARPGTTCSGADELGGPASWCAPRTSPRSSSTPAARPARRRAACSATTTTVRSASRSASAGAAPPTTSCSRRCRCSTSTRISTCGARHAARRRPRGDRTAGSR